MFEERLYVCLCMCVCFCMYNMYGSHMSAQVGRCFESFKPVVTGWHIMNYAENTDTKQAGVWMFCFGTWGILFIFFKFSEHSKFSQFTLPRGLLHGFCLLFTSKNQCMFWLQKKFLYDRISPFLITIIQLYIVECW